MTQTMVVEVVVVVVVFTFESVDLVSSLVDFGFDEGS